MSQGPQEAGPERRLRQALAQAVERGIVTDDQARRIIAIDTDGTGLGAEIQRRTSHLRPLVAEAVGYVGGALALVAAVILVEEFWVDLDPSMRVALLGAAAAGLFAAGAALRVEPGPLDRLRGFLWALSAAAGGGAVGVALSAFTGLEGEEIAVWVGLTAAVYGAGLWRARVGGLQQLVVFAGLAVAIVSGLTVVAPLRADLIGLAVWVLGLVWATAGWRGWLPPPTTAMIAGSAAALLGPATVGDASGSGWLLVVGLATAAAAIAVSIPLRLTILLGMGVAGTLLYVPMVVFEYFGDTLGAPVSLLLTGIVLVVVALAVARGRRPGPGGAGPGRTPRGRPAGMS